MHVTHAQSTISSTTYHGEHSYHCNFLHTHKSLSTLINNHNTLRNGITAEYKTETSTHCPAETIHYLILDKGNSQSNLGQIKKTRNEKKIHYVGKYTYIKLLLNIFTARNEALVLGKGYYVPVSKRCATF
jgi:hypothetical protein